MPPDAHALADRLRRDFDRFSPAQQSLARFLSEHLAEVPMLSAHEVARTAHCSPATVVRFAQTLGYSGYPEMQRAVRQAQRPGLSPHARHDVDELPSVEGLSSSLARDRSALQDAADRLRGGGLGPLASALAGRSPLVLAGEGYARPVLALLEERLARAGQSVVVISSLGAAERAWLDGLAPRAGVLAVVFSRESQVAEAALAAAQSRNAPACVLVDSPVSPLSGAPLARVVPSHPRGEVPSIIPMLAVAQALADALGRRSDPRRLAAAVA
jgi:DNA-binding MurR/RpiR family transcriptional regulator